MITSHLSSISSRVVSSETSPFAYLVWFLSFHPTLASCQVLQLRRALFSHYKCPLLLRSAQARSILSEPYFSYIFPSACQDFSPQHHTPVEILLMRSPFIIHGIGLCVLFIHFLYDKLLIISRCCEPNSRVWAGISISLMWLKASRSVGLTDWCRIKYETYSHCVDCSHLFGTHLIYRVQYPLTHSALLLADAYICDAMRYGHDLGRLFQRCSSSKCLPLSEHNTSSNASTQMFAFIGSQYMVFIDSSQYMFIDSSHNFRSIISAAYCLTVLQLSLLLQLFASLSSRQLIRICLLNVPSYISTLRPRHSLIAALLRSLQWATLHLWRLCT